MKYGFYIKFIVLPVLVVLIMACWVFLHGIDRQYTEQICNVKHDRQNEILELIKPYELMSEISPGWIVKNCVINKLSIDFQIYSLKDDRFIIVSLNYPDLAEVIWLKSLSFDISLSLPENSSDPGAAGILAQRIMQNDRVFFWKDSKGNFCEKSEMTYFASLQYPSGMFHIPFSGHLLLSSLLCIIIYLLAFCAKRKKIESEK